MKRSLFFIVLAAVIYSASTFTSCKKKGDTKAVITVIDTLGSAAPNIIVTLWQDTVRSPITGDSAKVRMTNTTDGSGKAEFTLPNEAFLNIDARRVGDVGDTIHWGQGFIRLTQYETRETTINLPRR